MAESPINQGQPPFETDPNKILPDKEMLKLCMERWEAAKDWRAGKESQWQRWYKLYRSYAERKSWPHTVSLFIPLIWSTVESFLPRLVVQKPTILVEARGDENIESASYHRQLLGYQWQDLNIPMVIEQWEKEALIYGTGIAKVGWETKRRDRLFRIKTEDGKVIDGESENFKYKDDPFIAVVPIENFYPEPGAPNMEDARYVCERKKMTYHEIKSMAEELNWSTSAVAELKDKKLAAQDVYGEDGHKSERESTFGTSDSDMSKHRAQIWEFEVVEYWEDGRYCVFVTDPEVVLVNELNPFWHGRKPYLRIVDNALPGEFYGVGEPEVLESINIELNTLHNLRLENVERSVFQMFKVRIGSPITPDMAKYKPGATLWVNQQDDIEPLVPSQPPMALYREEDGLRMWAQIATGANDNFQGVGSDLQQETATGASILAQAAASRVGMKFLQLSSQGLEPLGEMLISLNEQYMDTERSIQVVGPQGATHQRMGPEQLATNGALMDVKLDIGATDPINREMKLQKDMNFLSILMQLYGDPNHPVIQVLIKRIADLADIHIDEELLMVQPNPVNVEASGGQAGSPPTPDQGTTMQDVTGVADQGGP